MPFKTGFVEFIMEKDGRKNERNDGAEEYYFKKEVGIAGINKRKNNDGNRKGESEYERIDWIYDVSFFVFYNENRSGNKHNENKKGENIAYQQKSAPFAFIISFRRGESNKKAPDFSGALHIRNYSSTTSASGAFLRTDSIPFSQEDFALYPSEERMISPLRALRRKRYSPALSV